MAGPVIRLGAFSGGSVAHLAHVAAGNQRAFIPDLGSGSGTVIWSQMQGRVGQTGGGSKRGRFYATLTGTGQGSGGSNSRVPAAVRGYTTEFSTSATFSGSGEGETITRPLDEPFTSARNAGIGLGVTSRDNSLVIGMTNQASEIPSAHNTWLYDRSSDADGIPADGYSTTVNAGHLAIALLGELNVAPNQPGAVSRSGTANRPTMTSTFSDPNETLNGGQEWDHLAASRHVWRWGGVDRWDLTYSSNATEKAEKRSIRQCPGTIPYDTTITYTVYHRDRLGEWSVGRTLTFSVPNPNAAPLAPTGLTPTGATVGSLTPTMRFTHRDPDGDSANAVNIQVQTANGSSTLWNLTTPISVANNAQGSVTYSGSSLSYSTWYRWRARTRDTKGVFGPFSDWGNFKIDSGGSMDRPSSPTGRVTNPSNPGNVTAVYRNTAAVNATTIQFRLQSAGGSTLAFATFGGVSVAPNSTFTRTWAEAFPDVELGDGYVYSVSARAIVSGSWTSWSGSAGFTTNARPNIPTLYQPPNGNAYSSIPVTGVKASDPDQSVDELTVTAEIYNADTDTLLDTYNLPQAVSGWDVFRTAPTGIPHGNYKWRAQASDGFLTSAWSPLWTFTYAAVPSVTITSPTGPTVTTSQPLFEWVSVDQTHWRLQGFDGDRLVYDTGEVAGSDQSHAISGSANWIGGERWNNHEEFQWILSVRDASTLWGSSDALNLTLEYIPPEPFTIESVDSLAFPGVAGTQYVVITTNQADVLGEDFIRTIVDRVAIDGPGGNEIDGTLRESYFEENSSGITTFADFEVVSRQWYRYSFRYEVQAGVDVIVSEPAYAEAMVSFNGIMLHMPFDPLNTFVWLPYGEERYEPEVMWHQRHTSVMTVNGRAPHGYSDTSDYVEWNVISTLVERENATVEQQRDDIRRLWKYQNGRFSPNGRPNSICFREGRGGDDALVFGRISEPRRRNSYGRLYTMEFQFQELEPLPVNGGAQ